MARLFAFIVFFYFTCFQVGFSASPGDVTNILNKIMENYDKRVRPDYGEKAIEINVTMYILRGMEMSERDQSWKIQFYFRQAWQDRRLAFNFPGISNITVGPEMARRFWQPDTFFPASTSTLLKSDEKVFFRIKSDGTILTSAMVTADAFCPMDLTYYPHDTQQCTLEAESYGYTSSDIFYRWKETEQANEPVGYDSAIMFEDKKILSTSTNNRVVVLTSGRYSGVALKVLVTRNSGYFCRQFYLPAICLALVTWFTFWVPDSSKVFRGIAVMVSFLAYWVLSFRASILVPRLDYSTRLERYTTACLVLSLMSVAEFIVVLVLSKRFETGSKLTDDKNDRNKESVDAETGKANDKMASYVRRSVKYVLSMGQHRRAPLKIDLLAKIVYPVVFVAFNIWYAASLPSA